MRSLSFLFLPFALLYGLIIQARHFLYDHGIFKVNSEFSVPIICVGNLNLGGTGKTPFTEMLIRLLSDRYKITILSRGYGRKSKGFIAAGLHSTPQIIGDEPFQIYSKFQQYIRLVVCEDRSVGVTKLLKKFPETELIILDDAYQHRRIKAHINILLSTYSLPFYHDFLVPAGTLRDIPSAWKRSNYIIFTKSPNQIELAHQQEALAYTNLELNKELFYSQLNYKQLINPITKKDVYLDPQHKILLLTGIAQPKILIDHLVNTLGIDSNRIHCKHYPDHHDYSLDNLQNIAEIFGTFAEQKSAILTTEKDWVKIAPLLNSKLSELPWCIAKIEFKMDHQEHFEKQLIAQIEETKLSIRKNNE